MLVLAAQGIGALAEWWNLVFLIPLILAVLYLGLCVFTGIGLSDHNLDTDADVDADADAEVEVDHGLDGGHDADTAEGDHDADGQGEAESEGNGVLISILGWIGAGSIPLSFAIILLLLTWGLVGMLANQFLVAFGVPVWMIPLISMPMAGVIAITLVRTIAKTVRKYSPMKAPAPGRDALIGLTGEAISDVDRDFGMIVVRSRGGDLFQLAGRVPEDRPAISKGAKVLLVDYDKNGGFFYVLPDELAAGKQLPG